MGDEMTARSRQIVLDALAGGIPRSFDQLVARCGGLYPTDVAQALRQLSFNGISVEDFLTTRDTEGMARDGCTLSGLAPPHPLDFDWRFDETTALALCERAYGATKDGDTIVACGTPTFYITAIRKMSGRILHLHDSNAETHDFSAGGIRTVRSFDLSVDLAPSIYAQHIVADPPWYPDYSRLFLWWCAQISAPNATISLAMAPPNVRPSINDERKGIWSFASKLGMSLFSVEEGILRYETPPFERRALSAAGLPTIPDWRTGSLATLEITGAPDGTIRPVLDRDVWDRAVVHQTDLRFRRMTSSVFDPRLTRIVEGDTLDTVSTRDSRRARAMVWTTLNRIYGCENPSLAHKLALTISPGSHSLVAVLDDLQRSVGRSPTRVEMAEIEETLDQLDALGTCESATVSRSCS